MAQDLIVVKVDRARALLAEARDAVDAKQVADLALAAEVYAKRQKLSEEAIGYATAVKVDALTMMGEFLKVTPKAPPGRPLKNGSRVEPISPPTLAETGISKKASASAQALADLKVKAPDVHEAVRTGKKSVSQGVRAVQRQKKTEDFEARAAAAPEIDVDAAHIVTGDCLAGLRQLRAGSVRLAFADPPYNQKVNYGQGGKADDLPAADYLAWCCAWMEAVPRVLTEDGSFWVLISDEWADHFGLMLRNAGLYRQQWLIWYESFGVCNATKRGFTRASRHLFWCVKDQGAYVFHPEAVTRESWRQRNGDKRADPGGRTWDSVWGIDPPIPRLVDNAAERVPGYPTQLPLALLLPLVGCASDPGDLVIDLFAGSASLGEASLRLGRRFKGFELSETYADLGRKRLRAVAHDLSKEKNHAVP